MYHASCEYAYWLEATNLVWHVLNIDGAYKSNTNRAYAGGLLPDHTGSWYGGYLMNIGCCFIFQVEL